MNKMITQHNLKESSESKKKEESLRLFTFTKASGHKVHILAVSPQDALTLYSIHYPNFVKFVSMHDSIPNDYIYVTPYAKDLINQLYYEIDETSETDNQQGVLSLLQ